MSVARIAVVAGDGIGTEVIAQARKVIDAVLPGVEYDRVRPRRRASTTAPARCCPGPSRTSCAGHDAILLGAVGDPSVPPGVLERGLLLKLRFDFDQYVNLRPSRLWPGTTSPLAGVKPGEIDMVVVREGTEGLYAGAGGILHQDTPAEIATEESLNTRHGVERVIRDAFARAAAPRAPPAHPGAQDQRADPRRRAVGAHVRRGRGRVPRHRHRVPAHRRGQHVHGQQPAALRRRGDRQPLRRHPHRHRRRRHRRHRPGRQRLRSTRSGRTRRCSSRCTARRRTSPARASPTRPPPILSASLLLDHLGHADAARRVTEAVAAEVASRTPGAPLRTAEVGDRIAASAEPPDAGPASTPPGPVGT